MATPDPGLYARSFADVYDAWYGDLGDADDVVRAVARSLPSGARVVEFGAGTGRLAGPLTDAGFDVIGVDISPPMLTRCAASVHRVAADIIDLPLAPATADGVLIAFNTLFNLTDPDAQRRCLAEAARITRPDGLVIVDSLLVDATAIGTAVTTRDGTSGQVVMVTETTAGTEHLTVRGAHFELSDTGPIPRPWVLCTRTPRQLDAAAASVGLRLDHDAGGWVDAPGSNETGRRISWYRRHTSAQAPA